MDNTDRTAHKKDQGRLEQLLRIGLALSSEKNIGKLLEMVVDSARLISNADGGTLYIIDKQSMSLNYEILQNESMRTRLTRTPDAEEEDSQQVLGQERRKRNRVEDREDALPPPVPLYIDGKANLSNVSSYVALHCETVNIPDVYDAKNFNFSGPKAYDATTGYRTQSMLVIPMANHANEVIGVLQLINARDSETGEVIPFSEEDTSFVSSLASQAAVAMSNAHLIEHLVHDIGEIKKLRNAEKRLNENLRNAFLKTEEVNKNLTAAIRKVRVIQTAGVVFGILVLLGVGGFFLVRGSILGSILPSMTMAPQKQDIGQSFKVIPQPVSSTLSLPGTLDPLHIVNVISPISGKVKEISFHYGALVKEGQVLLQMDTSEVDVKLREAQTAYDRAAEKLAEVEKWEDGPEATKVKRSLTKAKLSAEAQKKTFENTERLFKRGLVSATEFDSAKQQYTSQLLDLQTAQEEVQATLQKGNLTNKNIVLREKKNAETRLKELQRQQRMSRIVAPVTGVITLPAAKGAAGEVKKIDIGSPVQEGGLLFSIGDLAGYSIKAKVDEVNILKVKQGQTVLITGDAFPGITLRGHIDKISSQAATDSSGSSSGAPSFEIIVVIDKIPAEHQAKIYVGMSANLEVIIHEKKDALMVPVFAVQAEDGKRFVMKKAASGQAGPYQKVEVKTGYSTMDAVEITNGLVAGDEILVTGQ